MSEARRGFGGPPLPHMFLQRQLQARLARTERIEYAAGVVFRRVFRGTAFSLRSWTICNNEVQWVEMRKWWTAVGPTMGTQVPNDHREAAESRTGRIPIFLQALTEVKAQESVPGPQLNGDELWELLMEGFLGAEPVVAMCQNIAEFYSQTRRRFEPTHDGSWRL